MHGKRVSCPRQVRHMAKRGRMHDTALRSQSGLGDVLPCFAALVSAHCRQCGCPPNMHDKYQRDAKFNAVCSARSAGLSRRLAQGALRLNAVHCFVVEKTGATRLTFEVGQFPHSQSVIQSTRFNGPHHTKFATFGTWERFRYRCCVLMR